MLRRRVTAHLIQDTVKVSPSLLDVPLYPSCQHEIGIAILDVGLSSAPIGG